MKETPLNQAIGWVLLIIGGFVGLIGVVFPLFVVTIGILIFPPDTVAKFNNIVSYAGLTIGLMSFVLGIIQILQSKKSDKSIQNIDDFQRTLAARLINPGTEFANQKPATWGPDTSK